MAVGNPKELCVAHEEVHALHTAAFFFLVDASATVPPVALLVRTSRTLLVTRKWENIEFVLQDACAQGAVDGRENIFNCYERVVQCINVNSPGQVW